ncbi:MAG TPA: hypothetical protein VMV49_17175 [Candidatus Deferrimicrobium sp.]|nr:hypothetical protein [Candidatus Deferrimicrobium sp.]
MFGYVILRDIPKEKAQLDLYIYEIQGGFRGFSEVPPGIHYVNVEAEGEMSKACWCYLKPSGVIVKNFDYEKKEFHDDTPEGEAHCTSLASSGAMDKALIRAMQQNPRITTDWIKLVSHINEDNFPVSLHLESPMMPPEDLSDEEMEQYFLKTHKSRFEQAFYDTHQGDQKSFLAEFQFAFVCSLVEKAAPEAFDRWLHLLQAIYNAGERCIEANPELFSIIIDVLIIQFKYLPDDWFSPDSKIVHQASYLIEDMIDIDISSLKEKAQEFIKYLNSRGITV